MKIFKIFFLITFLVSNGYASWTTSGLGSYAPTGAAKNIDVDSNFHLLFGGSGYSAYGDFVATGESIMYQTNATTDNYAGTLYNSTPKYMTVDTAFNGATYTNGDARKANSSSAKLTLPSYVKGTHIVWAGLFWQGQLHKNIGTGLTTAAVDADIAGWNSVTLKTPDGIMHQLTAPIGTKNSTSKTYQYTYKDNTTYRHFYSGYVDVTNLVKNTYSSTNNTFTVGNIKVTSGTDEASNMYFSHANAGEWWSNVYMGHFGGWSLVVVYALDTTTAIANPSEKLKNVSIYDGFDQFMTWSAGDSTFETNINLSGFWTPKSGPIKSKLLFFGGGADQGIVYNKLQIQQKKTAGFTDLSDGINPVGNQFNSTFSNLGTQIVSGKPYHHGMDLDIYDVSNMMDVSQSSTNVKFGVMKHGSVCDQVFPQILAFSTQLYEPQLCYDYSYKQDNQYLKAENSGASGILPMLKGTISNSPLEVAIYLRNKEADINVKGVSFYTDLNTSRFDYKADSTATTNVNATGYTVRSDSTGGCTYNSTSTSSVACNDGHNVRIGLGNGATGFGQTTAGYLGSQEFVYGKFELSPRFTGIKDVNESLGLKLNYYIQPDTSTAPIVYTYTLGQDINLCPPSSGYNPVWGTFNVVDHYASSVNGLPANNLRTQVSRKPFEVDVATYEKNTDGKYTKKPTIDMNTTVVVEVIDNDAFHDVNASCANPGSVITSPIYVGIANTSKDMTIDIPKQDISYHNFAVKNAAYRLWYFANQDQSLINWNAYTSDTTRRNLTSISGLYQSGYHTVCSTACASPTSTTCFNCIKINYAKPLCSRDNFSVRPEAFNINIIDSNQSVGTATQSLSNLYGYTPDQTPTTRIKSAAGYEYGYDINATGYENNVSGLAAVPRYTRYFSGARSDYNATMYWSPTSTKTGCNDMTDRSLEFFLKNGSQEGELQKLSQIGEYRLNMIDTSWTAVDQITTNSYRKASNGFSTSTDCILDSDVTLGVSGVGKVGCNISSQHQNSPYQYKDQNITYRPYKFDLSSFTYGVGWIPNLISANQKGYVYDANLSNNSDINMSVRATGNIRAIGADDAILTNFVRDCYATDLNLTITQDANVLTWPFSARTQYTTLNTLTNLGYTAKVKIGTNDFIGDVADSNFTKTDLGATRAIVHINFDRNATTPYNPQRVAYSDLNISCADLSDCNRSADLSTSSATGGEPMDFNVTHFYGRAQGVDSRIAAPATSNTATGNIRVAFEAYCDLGGAACALFFPNTTAYPGEDRNWYRYIDHNITNDGKADLDGIIVRKTGVGNITVNETTNAVNGVAINVNGGGFQRYGATYDGAQGYPHRAIMRNIPANWLIYNSTTPGSLFNEFSIEFNKQNAGWVGKSETETSTDSDAAINSSRRIMW